jgi:hypothetical protein
MAALLASARARAAEFEKKNGHDEDAMDEDDGENDVHVRKDSSRKAFDKVYKQVVDSADVVLYVIDARDPEGTRSKEVEQMVMAADGGSKRMIFILNKIDLIPPPVLKSWLSHLRRSFPTLPLRASKPAANAKTFEHRDLSIKGTSEALFKALKTFAESRQLKRSIKVGIIGAVLARLAQKLVSQLVFAKSSWTTSSSSSTLQELCSRTPQREPRGTRSKSRPGVSCSMPYRPRRSKTLYLLLHSF